MLFTKFLLMFSTLTCVIHGSTITVDVTPDSFMPLITKNLTVRCALGDDNTRSAKTVGSMQADSEHNTQELSITRTFRSAKNIVFLSSIVISREKQDIALITNFAPANLLSDFNNTMVSGSVSGSTGELVVSWSDPTFEQQGNYTCTAVGFDLIGPQVVFNGIVSVEQKSPTFDDLVKYVYTKDSKLEIELNAQKAKEIWLESELKAQTAENVLLRSQMAEIATNISKIQHTEVKALEARNVLLEAKMAEMATNISIIGHNTEDQNVKLDAKIAEMTTNISINRHSTEAKNVMQEAKIAEMANNISIIGHNTEAEHVLLAATIAEMATNISIIGHSSEAKNVELAAKIAEMATNMTKLREIEFGAAMCEGIGQAGGHTDPTSRTTPVTFRRAHSRPPWVYVAVNQAYWDKDADGGFYVSAQRVTSRGFTLHCGTASYYHMSRVDVAWLALPYVP